MFNILIVEDQKNLRESLAIAFKREGYEVDEAQSGEEALEHIRKRTYDLVVVDLKMGSTDGLSVLKASKEMSPSTEFVVMTAYGTIDSAVQAMKYGAYDYITKPFQPSGILTIVKRAMEKKRLSDKATDIQKETRERYKFDGIIGNSPEMSRVLNILMDISASDSTVLITGESGTGKELVARAIHENSKRANMPFIVINCGALPENLQESELFGHVKGSFTGAVRDKKGLFLEAQGGTLFLDEIGETSRSTQVKLLRFLQNGEIRSVGENKPIYLNARILVATNKNPEEEIASGSFRKDLFYRLNVIRIHLPPLRERKEDIPVLANYFATKFSEKMGLPTPMISGEAMAAMANYPWPGNVRELENIMERTVTLLKKKIITPADLALILHPQSSKTTIFKEPKGIKFTIALEEKRAILQALERYMGNRSLTARALGISTTTLWRKMKDYRIESHTKYDIEQTN